MSTVSSNNTPRTSQGSSGGTPQRTPDYQGMIEQLQSHIMLLENRLTAKSVKVKPPEAFDGTRHKLRAFITQLDLYIHMNREQLADEGDKVLFASTYLTGPAFDWFEPFIRNYRTCPPNRQDEDTKEIFGSFEIFKQRLEGTFGDIDAKRNAERKIARLRQTGSAAHYASEFQKLVTHLDWDDDAFIAIFEEGLKPEVQEKLIWMDRPDTLTGIIEKAVKIDNCLHELNLRRQGGRTWHGQRNRRNGNYRANDRRPAQPRSQGYDDPYGPKPMELDATKPQRVSQQERERRKKERLCYNCGKPGHMSKDCRQKKEQREPRQQLRATREASETQEADDWWDALGTLPSTPEGYPTHDDKENMQPGRGDIPSDDDVDTEARQGISQPLPVSYQQHQRKNSRQEPVQEDSEDEYPQIDWEFLDPLDEEYGTQLEGPIPGREVTQEIPETPLRNSPELYVAQILTEISERQINFLNGQIEDAVRQGSQKDCIHWNLDCWDKTERWGQHLTHCHHDEVCNMCQRNNTDYHMALLLASYTKPKGPFHHACTIDWCSCKYYRAHPDHQHIPWVVCYDDMCERHYDMKAAAKHKPTLPLIILENGKTCPCRRPDCSCIGYPRHPDHNKMSWIACYDDNCLTHYRAKVDEGRLPQPMRWMNEPNWEPTQMAATQNGLHLKIQAVIADQSARVMIDSGAAGNFMHPEFFGRLGISGVPKARPIPVEGLSGEDLGGSIEIESGFLTMAVRGHLERINFNVFPVGKYDIVLGIPWLRKHNPVIDWQKEQVTFHCKCPKGPSVGDTGTVRPVHEGELKDEVKRPGGGSNRAIGTVIAATTIAEKEWLMSLSGWAPANSDDYAAISSAEETPESSQDEGFHSQEQPPSASEGSESWERLAATQEPVKVPQEYERFQDLFKQPEHPELPEHGPHDHTIPLKKGTKPSCRKIYSMSERESRILKEYIDENLKKGTIRPSKSSAGHGVLFVPKKGGELRLCVDYRPLNDITIKDRHPLPLISEIQDRIRGAKWFTKLDITNAYNRLRIAAGEEWKTAFRTKYGHYEYTVMPFGLTNAPASFQRFINEALGEYLDDFVIAYLDDILIFSKTIEEHTRHVRSVLRKLRIAKVQLKLKKCEFHVQETEFLGHWITQEGVQTEKTKVQAIRDWPQPKNLKELQQFTGLVNYYRRFVDRYADTMMPLFKLLKKSGDFSWGKEQQEAFEKIKDRLTTSPILVQHDPQKVTTIETDASDYAIGMRMTQPGEDGKPRPIAFHSRKLIPAELNYDIHDKELLAIVVAFKVWRVYLEGAQQTIIVKTDHKNLTYFTTTKELTRRQARWSEVLSQYDFKIVHCKGTENSQADALSRRPDYELKDKIIEPAILKKAEDGSIVYNKQQLAATIHIQDDMIAKIIKETKTDQWIQEMLEHSDSGRLTSDEDGIVYLHGLIYVPEVLRDEIIQMHHDVPLRGHFGTEKVMEQISRNYYFPNMRRRIEKYIKRCDTCIRDKPSRHQPYGLMQSPDAPTRPWQWVTIDFIGPLPLSKGHDSITVITDRLTKYVHFEPSHTTMDAPELARIFFRTIIANHGMPTHITSDRDKLFTSKFWTTLTNLMGIDQHLTTAYHPQANGQTERTNQTLEQYLRHYVNYQQDDWTDFLPLAQFAYNNACHATTKESPFFANYGFNPIAFGEPRVIEPIAEQAHDLIGVLAHLHTQLSRDIDFMNLRSKIYYDRRHGKEPDFKRGEKVYLLRRNIKTKRPSQKLDHQKLGPFEIDKKTGPVNYRLKLPATMRKIHPVFHVSLLEPAPENAKLAENVEIEEETEQEYEVEKILEYKRVNGKPYYLIKWVGYDTSENTWEPIEHLTDCRRLVQQFHQELKDQRPPRRKEKGDQSPQPSE